MSQQVTQFLEELNSNEKLQQQLNEHLDIKSGETEESDKLKEQILHQITDFAKDQGYDFSADEYQTTLKSMQEELSEEELEKIAGGGIFDGIVATNSWLTDGVGCAIISAAESSVKVKDCMGPMIGKGYGA